MSGNNVEASVNLNGNTIKEIQNSTSSTILTPTTHYTVSGSTITFKAEYLDGLAAGIYELEVLYNPGCEIFYSGYGDEPLTTTINLTVNKAAQSPLSITGLNSPYTYGDEPFEIEASGGSGTGNVMFESNNEDVATVETAENIGTVTIHKAGTFKITATKAEDENYNQTSIQSSNIIVNPVSLYDLSNTDSDTNLDERNWFEKNKIIIFSLLLLLLTLSVLMIICKKSRKPSKNI
jgi:hypothetical protein